MYAPTINGCPVIVIPESSLPIEGYVQARKHRKHRTNKKWLKRYGMKPVYNENFAYVVNMGYTKTICVSQKVYDKLKEEINESNALSAYGWQNR